MKKKCKKANDILDKTEIVDGAVQKTQNSIERLNKRRGGSFRRRRNVVSPEKEGV